MKNNIEAINSSEILNSFFKEFYYELLKCKEIALRTTKFDQELEENPPSDEKKEEEQLPEEKPEAANENQNPNFVHEMLKKGIPVHAIKAIENIQTRLKHIINSQILKSSQFFNDDVNSFKEAHYAMVSLADEIFLNIPWKGSFAWQNLLLEGQLFQTQSSGETIFQKIDELLSRYDTSKIGVARIYFSILSLGFKGKYTENEDLQILKSYKKRIYAFIHGTNPSVHKYGSLKLMPECYEYNITSGSNKKLPDVKFWTKLIISIIILYIFASYILWYDVASDIYKSLENVFNSFSGFFS